MLRPSSGRLGNYYHLVVIYRTICLKLLDVMDGRLVAVEGTKIGNTSTLNDYN